MLKKGGLNRIFGPQLHDTCSTITYHVYDVFGVLRVKLAMLRVFLF